jgi:hypothetical protein
MAMIAITTSNSTSVNPSVVLQLFFTPVWTRQRVASHGAANRGYNGDDCSPIRCTTIKDENLALDGLFRSCSKQPIL